MEVGVEINIEKTKYILLEWRSKLDHKISKQII
jgi:hypothetical protein